MHPVYYCTHQWSYNNYFHHCLHRGIHTYYLLKDDVYDKAYQDILLDTDYTLENNMEDIIGYFSDNITDLLDDIDYPINEDTDVTPAIEGFAEYVKWLYEKLAK